MLDPRERRDFAPVGNLADTLRIKRGGPFMHLKTYEIDGAVLRTGSANFSSLSEKPQDLIVIREDTGRSSGIDRLILRRRGARRGPARRRPNPSERTRPPDTAPAHRDSALNGPDLPQGRGDGSGRMYGPRRALALKRNRPYVATGHGQRIMAERALGGDRPDRRTK